MLNQGTRELVLYPAARGRTLPLICWPPTLRPASLPPQGRPVYIQHIGAIKIKQLAEITTEDRMIRFHIQVGGQGAVGGAVSLRCCKPSR